MLDRKLDDVVTYLYGAIARGLGIRLVWRKAFSRKSRAVSEPSKLEPSPVVLVQDVVRPINGTLKAAVEAELAAVKQELQTFPEGVGQTVAQDYLNALYDALGDSREG